MASYIGAIDQGTTSTRFIVFDRTGRVVAVAQKEHEQIYPHPGWVEHDCEEIWRNTQEVIAAAMAQRSLLPADLAAAVSYTHLDVYKRQLLTTELFVWQCGRVKFQ